jgi:catechol 2,3-dioxygenase-like lactoylglutathione lyase family enzyme
LIEYFIIAGGTATLSASDTIAIAIVVAVIAAATSFFTTILTARFQRRNNDRVRAQEQLANLYNPIWILTNYTKRLQLDIGGKDADWRLLNSVEDVTHGSPSALIAVQIVEANTRTTNTICEFSGLTLEGSIPSCFLDFLEHAAIVRAAIESKTSPPPENRPHYPKSLDTYILSSVRTLQGALGLPIIPDGHDPLAPTAEKDLPADE